MGISDIFQVNQIKEENERLKRELARLQAENTDLYNTISGQKLSDLKKEIEALTEQNKSLNDAKAKADDELKKTRLKTESLKTIIKAAQKAVKADMNNEPEAPNMIINTFSLFTHISEIHYNCLDVPDLRKLFSANKTNIKKLILKYENRYTTKTNKALYQLMILGLEAELQNILLNLRFGTADKAKEKVNSVTKRYYEITANGNQSIAPTLKKFIDELVVYYMEAVDIEYEYYAQKERIKEEQKAIKEQMRQEAEEQRILQQQQKHIEKEEKKYQNEIENVKISISTANDDEMEKLKQRLAELENMLNNVEDKKEQIINLQNGQAGNVYVISNIGSFGENVFKVGMTRRIEPQDRIDELSNASVPFPFDVHCFIFSDNAIELETMLHKALDNKRLNKINKRKEFFNVSLNELEQLVHKIQPTAEFKMTALAEQYNMSARIPDGDIIYSEVKPQNINKQTANTQTATNTTNTQTVINTPNTQATINTANTQTAINTANTQTFINTPNTQTTINTANTQTVINTPNTQAAISTANNQATINTAITPPETSFDITDKIKNIIKNYNYQEEPANGCTRLHIYSDNSRKLGIIKIYSDNKIEFKRPGEQAQQISLPEDIKNFL